MKALEELYTLFVNLIHVDVLFISGTKFTERSYRY